MKGEKLGEEYYKYLVQTHQKASENMSALLRTFFIALIAFGFAPALQTQTPTLLIQYKFWFISAVVLGILGICAEFVQYLFASWGSQFQFSSIANYICEEKENGREPDFKKFFEFKTDHAASNFAFFWVRIVVGAMGLVCIGYPLLSWMASIK